MRKILILFFALLFFISLVSSQTIATYVPDSIALADFSKANGDVWDLSTQISTWRGVALIQEGRFMRVLSISFSNEWNADNMPPIVIPSSFTNLDKLEVFTLTSMIFYGNENLGNNSAIKELHIDNSNGPIPTFTGLSNLRIFDAGTNNVLTGSFPDISNLTLLESFDVRNNQLYGNIPDLNKLINLNTFNVSYNNLTGQLPPLSNFVALQYFDVSYNELSGNIPDLSQAGGGYNLSHNNFTGGLPKFSNYSQSLNVSYNDLSGVISIKTWNPVPPDTDPGLTLNLSHNKFNDYAIESDFFGSINIESNLLNFSSIEKILNSVHYVKVSYIPQLFFDLTRNGKSLSAINAGGNLETNTYTWYKDDVIISSGPNSSTYTITKPGKYYVDVVSKEILDLILNSNDFIVTAASLPVHITSFKATSTKAGNQITWTTGVESNTKNFNVQVSTNGKDFKDITFIQPKGSNSSYQYLDENKYQTSTLYYRLAIHDNDGPISYSGIYILKVNAVSEVLSVSPNPASSKIKVQNANGTITIYDGLGRTVITKQTTGTETEIQVGSLYAGVYYIKDGSGAKTKFIKK